MRLSVKMPARPKESKNQNLLGAAKVILDNLVLPSAGYQRYKIVALESGAVALLRGNEIRQLSDGLSLFFVHIIKCIAERI